MLNLFEDNMKKIVYIFILIIFISCSDPLGKKEKFIETYKEVLIAREMFSDSTKLEQELKKVYNEHGYNYESDFNEDFNSYKKDMNEFLEIVDTVRARARAELQNLKPREEE